MTDDQIKTCNDLWREALAAGLVRWQRGMFTSSSRFIAETDPLCVYTDAGVLRMSPADVRPVWTAPTTVGCLLAMAREATGDAEASCVVYGGRWHCDWHGNESIAETEPEALLRAIKEATR